MVCVNLRYWHYNHIVLVAVIVVTGALLLHLCRLYNMNQTNLRISSYNKDVEELLQRMNHVRKLSKSNFDLLQRIEGVVRNGTVKNLHKIS